MATQTWQFVLIIPYPGSQQATKLLRRRIRSVDGDYSWHNSNERATYFAVQFLVVWTFRGADVFENSAVLYGLACPCLYAQMLQRTLLVMCYFSLEKLSRLFLIRKVASPASYISADFVL